MWSDVFWEKTRETLSADCEGTLDLMDRRLFFGSLVSAALSTLLTPKALWPLRPLGPISARPTANVRDFGARGDGQTDDTNAFRECIDSLRPNGGICFVPSGTYLIDPLHGVALIDHLTLKFAPGAVLKASAVRASQSSVIIGRSVRNVALLGGTVIGERNGHLGVGGEWGMGVDLRGCSDARIEHVKVRECWGDGIYIGFDAGRGCERIAIRNCICRRNRRQGLSITACVGAVVQDCDFSDTEGTAPEAGIDIEPDRNSVVRDVKIVNCTMLRNAGFGTTVVGSTVSAVSLSANRIESNRRGGILVLSAMGTAIESNIIQNNGGPGIFVTSRASATTIVKNTIRGNGQSAQQRFDNVLIDGGAKETVISGNDFRPDVSESDPARYDVRINGPDCVGTKVMDNLFRPHRGQTGGVDDHGSQTQLLFSSPPSEL